MAPLGALFKPACKGPTFHASKDRAEMRAVHRYSWSSRVRRCVNLRMAGAANSTTGNITSQARSPDFIQCFAKEPSAKNGKLAIAAAMAQVKPDWITP